MNKNFLCKKRIDFDKINIYNMRIFKNKTQNNKNKQETSIIKAQTTYPLRFSSVNSIFILISI